MADQHDIRPIHGVVKGRSAAVAPSAVLFYDVLWYTPFGEMFVADTQPTGQRWGPPLEVRAFEVGQVVSGYIVDGIIQWNEREIADHGECAAGLQGLDDDSPDATDQPEPDIGTRNLGARAR